jgi:hypothetical protein
VTDIEDAWYKLEDSQYFTLSISVSHEELRSFKELIMILYAYLKTGF